MMSTPDVTAVQKLVAAFTAVLATGLGVATSFGVNLTVDQDTKILALWAALGGFLVVADAVIRHGRSTGTTTPPGATTALTTKKPPAKP